MTLLSPTLFPIDNAFHLASSLLAQKEAWPKLGFLGTKLHFPVQKAYRVSSDLTKLEAELLVQDDRFMDYLLTKINLLQQRSDALLLPQTALAADVWKEIWQGLGLDQAAWTGLLGLDPIFFDHGVGELSRLAQRSWAQQLSLAMQEDWVLISPQGEFEAGSVCFPSGWAPSEKFGLSLAAIHGPVADGDALRKASDALTKAMRLKGPFQRFVWTLTNNESLSRHPAYPVDLHTHAGGAIYFRYERQTTLSLPKSGRALFLIRVYVVPLESALRGSFDASFEAHLRNENLALLQASLRSMSEEVMAYKGLAAIREKVLAMPPVV